MSADSLNLEIVTPQSPLILADGKFLATLTEVETQIASLAITDAPSAQLAASLQVRLTSAGKVLEDTRKQLKEPFIQAGRQIDAAAAAPANRIEAAKGKIKQALSAYSAEQARIAREAEEARQRELRRLEAIAREEERLAKEKADKLARELAIKAEEARKAAEVCEESVPEEVPEPLPVEPPQKTETQRAIEAVRYAPVVAAAKPVGVTMRVTLVPEITDIRLVPEVFVERTAKIAAIRATYCTSYKEGDPVPVVPGISFKIDRQMVSTGRNKF